MDLLPVYVYQQVVGLDCQHHGEITMSLERIAMYADVSKCAILDVFTNLSRGPYIIKREPVIIYIFHPMKLTIYLPIFRKQGIYPQITLSPYQSDSQRIASL